MQKAKLTSTCQAKEDLRISFTDWVAEPVLNSQFFRPRGPIALPFAGVVLGDTIELFDGRTGGSNETLSLAGYAHIRQSFFEDVLSVGLGLRYSYDPLQGRALYRYGQNPRAWHNIFWQLRFLFPASTTAFSPAPAHTARRVGTDLRGT